MSLLATDACLQQGRIGAFGQHLFIVVGFQYQVVGFGHVVLDCVSDVSDVGDEAEVWLFSCAFCRAASQVPVEMLGKNKGEVQVINKDGVNYAEAVRLSKILKLQTSWFGRSGQLNLKGPAGFFCVLRAGAQNAAVNGESYKLAQNVII